MSDKLVIQALYKIFGPQPATALRLLEEGLSKDEIFARTRTTVGVQGADFAIQEGEVFVVMGLSGSGKSTLARMLNRLIDDLQKAMYDAQETSYEEAVGKYIQANEKRIDYWVTGRL